MARTFLSMSPVSKDCKETVIPFIATSFLKIMSSGWVEICMNIADINERSISVTSSIFSSGVSITMAANSS